VITGFGRLEGAPFAADYFDVSDDDTHSIIIIRVRGEIMGSFMIRTD
jgi:hypothetical protein